MTNRRKHAFVFSLEINPKLTLRKALKDKIDDIITWLDLDDDDTKLLIEEKTSGDTVTQKNSNYHIRHTSQSIRFW